MVNRALQDLVGYTEKELLATTFQNITHPDDLAADLDKRRQLLAGDIPYFMMEKRYVHKHGHAVWILACVSLIRDRAGTPLHFLVQVQDITSRKQAETAIQVRDEFLSVAAHELKTPITAQQGFAQVTLRHIDHAGDSGVLDLKHVRRALQAIDQQAHKLNALVTQLLDVSRIERGQLTLDRKLTNVTELVEETVVRTQATTNDHTITLHAPSDLTANVDALRLEQVFTNLLDNAVKYSPQSGAIDVSLSLEGANHRWLLLTVTDHGIGIPPEHRARIFERFYQVQNGSIQGLGLGLFITRQIVEQHGGSIHAEFPPESGTRFVVRLPRL